MQRLTVRQNTSKNFPGERTKWLSQEMRFALSYVASHPDSPTSALLWAALHPQQHCTGANVCRFGEETLLFHSLPLLHRLNSHFSKTQALTGKLQARHSDRNVYRNTKKSSLFWILVPPIIENYHTRYHMLSTYNVPSLC